MRCCYKDSITTDSVHVNTRSTFHIIQMNVSIFGDKEDYAMFLTDLENHMHFLKDNLWHGSLEQESTLYSLYHIDKTMLE